MSTMTIQGDGLHIECIVSPSIDDRSRPLAVCLHGFPDSPSTWRHLAIALEAAGWRVASPYLRGYAPSQVPTDGCVQTAASVLDATAIHEQLGGDERAAIIGHDWGAAIAYGVANHEPHRWAKAVAMAVPPGSALVNAFLTNPDQLKRSWYMFFFQHALAELVVSNNDLAFIDMIWNDWSPDYDASADLPAVKNAIGDPANLAAAIGYYRAALGGVGLRDDLAEVQAKTADVPSQPLLYLHGAGDGCIGVEVAESARALVGPNVSIEIVDGVGHFPQLEASDLVNARIVEFLA